MKTILLYLVALLTFVDIACGQATTMPTSGTPAPILANSGVPSVWYTCNSSFRNLQYVQLDASPGQRNWFCLNDPTNGYIWENLKGPIAVANTGAVSASLLGLAGCVTTTVTIAGAVVGTNSASAAPIGMPTSIAATAGLVNITAYVSAANMVTVSVCALAALTTAAIPYRVLMY